MAAIDTHASSSCFFLPGGGRAILLLHVFVWILYTRLTSSTANPVSVKLTISDEKFKPQSEEE